jgi:adenosylmethionine-8-amino-7-oxononanoate aminotransferase
MPLANSRHFFNACQITQMIAITPEKNSTAQTLRNATEPMVSPPKPSAPK